MQLPWGPLWSTAKLGEMASAAKLNHSLLFCTLYKLRGFCDAFSCLCACLQAVGVQPTLQGKRQGVCEAGNMHAPTAAFALLLALYWATPCTSPTCYMSQRLYNVTAAWTVLGGQVCNRRLGGLSPNGKWFRVVPCVHACAWLVAHVI